MIDCSSMVLLRKWLVILFWMQLYGSVSQALFGQVDTTRIKSFDCYGAVSPQYLEFLRALNEQNENQPQPMINPINIVVRVHLWFINRDDGTGGVNPAVAPNMVNILTQGYAGTNICFSLHGVDVINNTGLFEQTNSIVLINDLTSSFNTPNAIDVFVGNDGKEVNGRANGIPSKAFFVEGAIWQGNFPFTTPPTVNAALTQVLSHEMGHCLGLLHTFETAYGVELVNGTNCATAGDRICDTPATPGGFIFCKSEPVACDYTCGNLFLDANNQPYAPLPNNIMDYIHPECMTAFTQQQRTVMRGNLQNNAILQNCIVPNNLVLTNLVVNAGQNLLYDVITNITAQDNVVVNAGGTLVLQASHEVLLLPGFDSNVGSNFTAQIEDDLCSTASTNPFNSAKTSTDTPTQGNLLPRISNSEFTLYPNPTTGVFTLQMSGGGSEGVAAGARVVTGVAVPPSGRLELDLRTEAAGMYLVQVVSETGAVLGTTRVAVQR
jgi:hypothetical protein